MKKALWRILLVALLLYIEFWALRHMAHQVEEGNNKGSTDPMVVIPSGY